VLEPLTAVLLGRIVEEMCQLFYREFSTGVVPQTETTS
jgi:hypothetical protein